MVPRRSEDGAFTWNDLLDKPSMVNQAYSNNSRRLIYPTPMTSSSTAGALPQPAVTPRSVTKRSPQVDNSCDVGSWRLHSRSLSTSIFRGGVLWRPWSAFRNGGLLLRARALLQDVCCPGRISYNSKPLFCVLEQISSVHYACHQHRTPLRFEPGTVVRMCLVVSVTSGHHERAGEAEI